MPAIVYPGADYRQLSGKSTTLLTPLVINVHTMVGTVAGAESWFRPSGQPYSHFGLAGSGAVRQWQDLRYRAASDLKGNPFCISIECEDHGSGFPAWSGSNVPHFLPAQLSALNKLLDWLCTRFAIPRVLLADSCQRNGIGYHRLGIDPYRREGCTQFSNARGKACPGDNRIEDVKSLFVVAPAIPKEWDEMATKDEIKAALREVLNEGTGGGQKNWAGTSKATLATAQGNSNKLNAVMAAVNALDAVDEVQLASLVLGVLTPQAIADALDSSTADAVRGLLSTRPAN